MLSEVKALWSIVIVAWGTSKDKMVAKLLSCPGFFIRCPTFIRFHGTGSPFTVIILVIISLP